MSEVQLSSSDGDLLLSRSHTSSHTRVLPRPSGALSSGGAQLVDRLRGLAHPTLRLAASGLCVGWFCCTFVYFGSERYSLKLTASLRVPSEGGHVWEEGGEQGIGPRGHPARQRPRPPKHPPLSGRLPPKWILPRVPQSSCSLQRCYTASRIRTHRRHHLTCSHRRRRLRHPAAAVASRTFLLFWSRSPRCRGASSLTDSQWSRWSSR